jgi:coproporphyrinogen III oxidase
MTPAQSARAGRARALVEALRDRFVAGLEGASARIGPPTRFRRVAWARDEGRHGGGARAVAADTPAFGRASVNVSQVHYDDLPEKRLASATAFSSIVHPAPPRAPSVHIHISYTELRDGTGYWRVMADLNPSHPDEADREAFSEALRGAAGELYFEANGQGDRYFFIPALDRHRGVTHFYLEGYATGDFDVDVAFAESIGQAAIDAYLGLLETRLGEAAAPTEAERATQLAYHTLYFFQVLTLDRGTTSGLLVHDQNDVGILGSLPPRVDRGLLASWRSRLPEPQDRLLDDLLAALPSEDVVVVGDDEKAALARAVRAHYRRHPDALRLQAAGDITPPTVANHQ